MTSTPPLTDDDRWQAVIDRSASLDGEFVYAVTTTGVYCRPSCASRKPRRDHVRFFALGADARRAGFRACRRCRPEQEERPDDRRAAVEHACRVIAEAAERLPTLAELSSATGLSPDTLRRAFADTLGVTPHQYADALRVERLRGELRTGGDVTGALFSAGYGSTSRVYEHAGSRLGMTPGAYRAGGTNVTIAFAIAPSSLGWVLAAATDVGVYRVMLGDDAASLETELRDDLPGATVTRDDEHLHAVLDELVRRLDGHEPATDLPLDVRGTAFQRRVWQELQRIPRGETRSYAEIAAALGEPRAARAVGGACAANELAIVIPCHRAVRADGEMGKYRWGSDRKRELLEHERSR